jgi:hypothetical protein
MHGAHLAFGLVRAKQAAVQEVSGMLKFHLVASQAPRWVVHTVNFTALADVLQVCRRFGHKMRLPKDSRCAFEKIISRRQRLHVHSMPGPVRASWFQHRLAWHSATTRPCEQHTTTRALTSSTTS